MLKSIVSGRVAIAPFSIRDRRSFVEYLESHATRIKSAANLQSPLLSRKKGLVFYENASRVLIRYNSEKVFGFTSACFLDASLENDGVKDFVRGTYRFPGFLEFPKYVILAFLAIWVLYFGYLISFGEPDLLEDSIIFVGGVIFLCAGAMWFGNVSASFFARSTIREIDALLAGYSDRL